MLPTPAARVWQRRGGWLLRLLIAAAILALVIRAVPVADVTRRVREASPRPLLLALALSAIGSLIVAARLRLLAGALGLSPTLATATDVNLSAQFYGLFLPGGNVTGGVIRFYRLAGSQRRVAAAAGAIAWDRLSATLALCLVGLSCWVLVPASKPVWPGLAFALGAIAIVGIMAAGVLVGRGTPGMAGPPPGSGRLRLVVYRIGRGIRELARPGVRDHAVALVLSIVSQVLGIMLYIALAASLGVSIPIITMGWIRSVVLLLLLLPITISGLGLREGALMVLLTAEGVGQVPAVAFGVLVFAATVLAPALVGGVSEGFRLLRPER
jgi:glycosyltransferase 2 family protein